MNALKRRSFVLLVAGLSFPLFAASQAHVELSDLDGKTHRPMEQKDSKAAVCIFVTQDCPVCNSYAPEINRIFNVYAGKGVAMYLVQVDPDLSLDAARKHAKDYSLACPVLLDARHGLVAAAGAKITPEAFVFSPDGRTLYHGRIDNTYADFGKARQVVTQHDLRDVLDALLAGKPLPVTQTDVVGCVIQEVAKDKKNGRDSKDEGGSK